MTVDLDPEGNELAALLDFTGNLSGKQVLEVGCGDGRMTWLYAHQAAHVVGIDPDADSIADARLNAPDDLAGRVKFHAASVEEYASTCRSLERPPRFDLAVLAWSL